MKTACIQKSLKRSVPGIFLFAEACDRIRVSNQATTFLNLYMLQDVGVISGNDTSSVIVKYKIERARKKSRMNNATLNNTATHLQSLYFDGKKDQTLTQTQVNGSMHKGKIVEKHRTLLYKPKSQYVVRFTEVTGSSHLLVNSILDYSVSNEINFADVIAVRSDKTAVNTGRKEGVKMLLNDHFN